MDPAYTNSLEVFRMVLSGVGLVLDLTLVWGAARRQRALWDRTRDHPLTIGRGHIMARSNVWAGLTIGSAHAALFYAAWRAANTLDGPMTQLGLESNVCQAFAAGALAAWAGITIQATADGDIIDARNAEVESKIQLIYERLDELFERYAGRTIRRAKE